MQNQVPVIQQTRIVTHLVEQAKRDKYHRLEALSQRGETEADRGWGGALLAVAGNAALSCKGDL